MTLHARYLPNFPGLDEIYISISMLHMRLREVKLPAQYHPVRKS